PYTTLFRSVFCMMSMSPSKVNILTPKMTKFNTEICAGPMLTYVVNQLGTLITLGLGEIKISAEDCSTVLTANEVMSIAFMVPERSGRKAIRSVATLVKITAAIATTMMRSRGTQLGCNTYQV